MRVVLVRGEDQVALLRRGRNVGRFRKPTSVDDAKVVKSMLDG